MVTGSLLWDNQRVGAQLGSGPLCWAMKGQPQLERFSRQGLRALEDGRGVGLALCWRNYKEPMMALQKAIWVQIRGAPDGVWLGLSSSGPQKQAQELHLGLCLTESLCGIFHSLSAPLPIQQFYVSVWGAPG